jgi:hypothetical protein
MTSIIEEIGATIMGAYEYCNTPQPLAAIWRTNNPTWLIESGERLRTVRFTKGQLISIKVEKTFTSMTPDGEKQYIDGEILDVTESNPATHRILATTGAATHSFCFKLEELATANHFYINLKD